MALALSVRQAEQAPVEVDIFKDAECRIKVAAQPLGHIGNPANLGVPVCLVCQIAAEYDDPAFLDDANAGDETEQRGLAGGVRPDHSDHLAGGLIRCSTRRSTIRRATDFNSSACGMLPK